MSNKIVPGRVFGRQVNWGGNTSYDMCDDRCETEGQERYPFCDVEGLGLVGELDNLQGRDLRD